MPNGYKKDGSFSGKVFEKGQIPWNIKEKIKIVCKVCNKEFNVYNYRINAKFCSKYCAYKYRQGKKLSDIEKRRKYTDDVREKIRFAKMEAKNPHWNGGRIKEKTGYILVLNHSHPSRNNENYVREHRLIIEKHLGRYLSPIERVHHINGKKDDNHIENLIAFTTEAMHHRFHKNPVSVKENEIIFDGRISKFNSHLIKHLI